MINDLKVQRKEAQDEIKRKRAEQPKQYAQGWTEFYKLKFKLTQDVLIPRPETELLVDEVLKISREIAQSKVPTIIDIGTGSGCIAISIAKNIDKVGIVGADISPEALKIAILNAKLNHIKPNKLVLITNDLYEKFTVAPDIIVTNLPYIPTARLMMIDPMVSEWEPNIALDGGPDGFELYRRLFTQIRDSKLFPRYLIAEIDHTHGEVAIAEIKRYFPKAEAEVKKDLAGKIRILKINF